MNDITEPLVLSRGSHEAGSGRGCAMNVISWENGDTTITDYPACSDPMLALLVQSVNDGLADEEGFLSPANSIIALELGHATVGTTGHDLDLAVVYRACVEDALRYFPHTFEDMLASHRALHLMDVAVDEADEDEPNENMAYWAAMAIEHASSTGGRYMRPVVAEWTIEKFKSLTGTTSTTPDPSVTACAVEKMLARA